MEQLADHFSLGVTTTALAVLRILMIPLLLYNMMWSFKGFSQLVRGIPFPSSIYQSVVFLFSTGILGAHALIFAGRPIEAWSTVYVLVLQCLFFGACMAAAYGRKISVKENFDKFHWLYNSGNLELAERVATMADYDKEFTIRSIDAAETALAIKMIQKGMNSEFS